MDELGDQLDETLEKPNEDLAGDDEFGAGVDDTIDDEDEEGGDE